MMHGQKNNLLDAKTNQNNYTSIRTPNWNCIICR